eukprot:3133604-Prymnesium_polylepis.1
MAGFLVVGACGVACGVARGSWVRGRRVLGVWSTRDGLGVGLVWWAHGRVLGRGRAVVASVVFVWGAWGERGASVAGAWGVRGRCVGCAHTWRRMQSSAKYTSPTAYLPSGHTPSSSHGHDVGWNHVRTSTSCDGARTPRACTPLPSAPRAHRESCTACRPHMCL